MKTSLERNYTVTDRIIDLMTDHGMSQARLARLTGVHRSTINRALKGDPQRQFTSSHLRSIAWAFNLTLEELAKGTADELNTAQPKIAEAQNGSPGEILQKLQTWYASVAEGQEDAQLELQQARLREEALEEMLGEQREREAELQAIAWDLRRKLKLEKERSKSLETALQQARAVGWQNYIVAERSQIALKDLAEKTATTEGALAGIMAGLGVAFLASLSGD